MKKIILTVLLIMAMGINVYADESTVLNCDFDSQEQYFQNSEYATCSGLSVSSDNTVAKEGSGSLKIDVTEEGSLLSSKIYNNSDVSSKLNTSDKYYLSFYAKVPEGSNITGVEAAYSYYRSFRTYEESITTQQLAGTEFVKVSAEFNIANTGRFTIILKPTGTGTVYIDELVLEKAVLPEILKSECIPTDASVDVSPSNEILVKFNKEVEESTVEGAVLVNNSTELIDTVVLSTDKKSCTVKLKENMAFNTEYTVTVNGIADDKGNEINDSISFTTVDNTATMRVVSITPADGTEDVATTGSITVEFSANVDDSTLNAAFLFNNSANVVAGTSINDGKTVVVSYSNLNEYAEYTFKIQNIADIYGNVVETEQITFTTGAKTGEVITFIDFDANLPKEISNWKATAEETTENAYSGKSLKLTLTSESSYQLATDMEKGVLYKYSFMASSELNNGTLKYALNLGSGNNKALGVAEQVPGGGEYKKYEGTIYLSKTEAVGSVWFYFWGSTGTFYVDDLKFTKESDFTMLPNYYPQNGAENVSITEPVKMVFNYPVSQVKNVSLNNTALDENSYVIDDKTLYIYGVGGGNFELDTAYTLKIGQIIDGYGRTIDNTQITFKTKKEFVVESAILEKNGNLRTLSLSQVLNNSTDPRQLVLKILVIKDGVLLKSEAKSVGVGGGQTVSDDVTLDLSTITETGYTVKATVWDAENGIMPIIKHIE